ncbi:site-specific integrase [Vibrio cyclitrophicus]|uniref:hypothetical protein n=1 Tax=Vibrio cyclitrophicus TaxID=47951 RepID=UPI0002F55A43|nr:hypothetical protein [Vibrio cyclitrophicus]OEF27348.1 hypothetical protein OA9_14380 [Vibrio cyclitrophicus 1F97]
MSRVSNTIKRGEIYHFNYRINDKVYRKSLKSDSPSTSRAYVSDIVSYIQRNKVLGMKSSKNELDSYIDALISNKVNEVVRLGNTITSPMSATARGYFNRWYTLVEPSIYHNTLIDNSASGAPYYVDIESYKKPYLSYNEWISSLLDKTAASDPLTQSLTQYSSNEEDWEINEQHPLYSEFINNTGTSQWYEHLDNLVTHHTNNISEANRNGDAKQLRMELDELKAKFSSLLPQPLPPIQPIAQEQEEDFTSPTFDTLWDDLHVYFSEIARDGKSTISNKKSCFFDLMPAFKGVPIHKITFEEVENAWNVISHSPALSHGEKYGFSASTKEERREKRWELIASNEITIEDEDLLKTSTLKDKKAFFTGLFTMAKRKNYIKENPLDLAQLDSGKERANVRTVFPVKHKKALISYLRANLSNPNHWASLIMAYHGFRNSEVTNLTKDSIVIDEDTNIRYFNIKNGKTEQSKRKVPIHNELLKLGFLEFIDQSPEKIFSFSGSDLTNYYFSVLRPKLNIPSQTNAGELLSLYSLRHEVVSQLLSCPPEIKYFLIGHKAGITANYTHNYLVNAQLWINKITYD